jgi:two-component system LytT family sensor kinase
MKTIIKPRNINIALHILIWGVLLLLPYLVSNAESGYKIGIIPGSFFTVSIVINMAIFYSNAFYLYPRLFNRRLWWTYILAAILLIGGSSLLKGTILITRYPGVLTKMVEHKFIYASSIAVFVISIIYRRIVDRIRWERELKERQAAQLATELKFLRSQISPHFLFNVLTNLVSLARKRSDRLEQSLIMLSDLMRYMLYDAQGQKGTLFKEIEYLKSYLELQKLRFGTDVQIDSRIELSSEEGHYSIEPMLLIPFVENAFKHGVGYLEHPRIDIRLSVDRGWLIFDVQNKFEDEPGTSKDESTGIGLENVRSRLNLLYKDRYTLTIDDQNNLFHIVLTLKLI